MARSDWFDAELHAAGGEENSVLGQAFAALDHLFDLVRGEEPKADRESATPSKPKSAADGKDADSASA